MSVNSEIISAISDAAASLVEKPKIVSYAFSLFVNLIEGGRDVARIVKRKRTNTTIIPDLTTLLARALP
jgi:hypothetical protein